MLKRGHSVKTKDRWTGLSSIYGVFRIGTFMMVHIIFITLSSLKSVLVKFAVEPNTYGWRPETGRPCVENSLAHWSKMHPSGSGGIDMGRDLWFYIGQASVHQQLNEGWWWWWWLPVRPRPPTLSHQGVSPSPAIGRRWFRPMLRPRLRLWSEGRSTLRRGTELWNRPLFPLIVHPENILKTRYCTVPGDKTLIDL